MHLSCTTATGMGELPALRPANTASPRFGVIILLTNTWMTVTRTALSANESTDWEIYTRLTAFSADFRSVERAERRSKRETSRAAAPLPPEIGSFSAVFTAIGGKLVEFDPLRGPVAICRSCGMAENGRFWPFYSV